MKVRITKSNKHLPGVKVNLNSSFGGGPWVYVPINPPCGREKVNFKKKLSKNAMVALK